MTALARWRDHLAYQPLSLAAVALITCTALVIAHQATRQAIVDAEERDLQNSLGEVLPAGFADNNLLQDTLQIASGNGAPLTIYRSRKHGAVNGAVFQTAARGYAGDIAVLIGVDAGGTLLGARVVKHQETPGLGDKIEAAKTRWIDDFTGKSLTSPPTEKWGVKKDGGVFDQFAGATITPRAVVKAVKQGLDFFAAHRAEIVDGAASAGGKP